MSHAESLRARGLEAVGFDFGQTLAELDVGLLAEKLARLGLTAHEAALAEAIAPAWQAYDAAVRAGVAGHPWHLFMRTLLARAGLPGARLDEAAAWLFDDQPRQNLWRKPIAGMIELVRELRGAGLAVVVISNSEGGLERLVDEMGWTGELDAVADSGRLGVEKPAPAIFEWAAARAGVSLGALVHVGDSLGADVLGALGAGCRGAIWFGGADPALAGAALERAGHPNDALGLAHDADGVRRALDALSKRVPA